MSSSKQLICQNCASGLKTNSTFCTECGNQVILDAVEEKTIDLIDISDKDVLIGYVQIVAAVEIALGFFISIIGGILILVGTTVTSILLPDNENVPIDFYNIIILIVFIIGILLVIFGILSVYFGTKLFQFQQMGRIGTMVISSLQLINVPFGTIFGVAALYLLVKREVIALFDK